MCVSVPCACSALRGGQRRASDPLEPKLQMDVSCQVHGLSNTNLVAHAIKMEHPGFTKAVKMPTGLAFL